MLLLASCTVETLYTAHMFVIGGYVQSRNLTSTEVLRIDIDYLEAAHRSEWFDDDLLEYKR